MDMERKCSNCLYADGCQFDEPCEYYLPLDFEERIIEIEERRQAQDFKSFWNDYMQECGEE